MIKKLDDLVSLIIKHRDKHRCQRCGKQVQGMNCQWSHIVTRGNKHLRWDFQNSLVLDYPCHRWWHSEPLEAAKWFAEKFPERYEYLMRERNKIKPISLQDLIDLYEELKPYAVKIG